MKIAIAYDGSSCADLALDDLIRAGLPQKVEALVISVAEMRMPPPLPSAYEIFESANAIRSKIGLETATTSRVVEDAYSLAFQASKLVQTRFPHWEVCGEAYSGSPAAEIIERAREWGADLIVLGSQGRFALGRLILGSVSQRVATNAHCSVRVARKAREDKDGGVRIVLGVDGSDHSGAAVRAVAGREWPEGSEVRLVTSIDPWDAYAVESADKPAGVRSIHQSAEAFLCEAGLEVSSVVEKEEAKHLLVRVAEEWKADSIFVGARGLGRLGRLLLGSVSTAVVANAHCTVEVIRTA